MKNFIFDSNPKMGDQTLTLGNTTYKLKVGTGNCTFHVNAKGKEPDCADFSFQDLRALYYLLNTNNDETQDKEK